MKKALRVYKGDMQAGSREGCTGLCQGDKAEGEFQAENTQKQNTESFGD